MAAVTQGDRLGLLKSKDIFEFQARGVLSALEHPGYLLCWDAGMGKSVGALATAVILLSERRIDRVLLVCERNKVREWAEDVAADTDLDVRVHHGPRRLKLLERDGLPRVLISTYETVKLDAARKAGPRSFTDGPLSAALSGQRVLVVYDESAKLRNRSSGLYRAHEYLLRRLRKTAGSRVLMLTATPLEKGYEDGFNQMRLLAPEAMPTVKDFERDYVLYRDPFRRARYNTANMPAFLARVHPLLHRKRKSDPDVIAQFPPLTEEYRYVEMGAAQRELYRTVEEFALEEADSEMGAWVLLRQLAGHPPSIVHSASALATTVVDTLGREHLRQMASAKADEVRDYLRLVMAADAKAVVFTFFGQSVLPDLEELFGRDGIPVFPYHGGRTAAENERSKQDFKSRSGGAVLLASDAGARGINLPEATYVIEYEAALTHAMRIQRRDRVHRITSAAGPVTALTFITGGTIEEAIFAAMLRRNDASDAFTGDSEDAGEEFISAADRRALLAAARARYENRRK